jgi:hypothetical protein
VTENVEEIKHTCICAHTHTHTYKKNHLVLSLSLANKEIIIASCRPALEICEGPATFSSHLHLTLGRSLVCTVACTSTVTEVKTYEDRLLSWTQNPWAKEFKILAPQNAG